MSNRIQKVSTEKRFGIHECVTVTTTGVKPSWKRFGDGSNQCEMTATGLNPDKPAAGWLEIGITETSYGEKRDVERYTSCTVRPEGMRALRDLLNKLDLGEEG